MYLSCLMIDTGNNPDRLRPGRSWLRNIYHVHQRLSMAFPQKKDKKSDPCPLLFRIDNRVDDNSPRAMILVQSAIVPDWEKAFANVSSVFLVTQPQVREYAPCFAAGERLRFRVRMNLSKKAKTRRDGTDLCKKGVGLDVRGKPKAQSKRVAVTWNGDEGETPEAAIREWFAKKTEKRGFEIDRKDFELLHLGWVSGCKPRKSEDEPAVPVKFRSALLEGTLTVKDGLAFLDTVAVGLGSAKAFGFGLLSVVHIRE